ncbi:hypothetical protein CHLRE_01g032650v5 [Chlamydomonas reinhardtii]|uniref:Transaldolase n=1 Tax=Chlamydomonas reinhardtii TaxID=3055 RepID=A8HQP0_CHLRE|nr:uncharacterized protein CHLRE_01g032650v5 [Chlamydomonas reinhardtii]PNW88509.1 hypothetical protein CHLRE_01g032650v5 [Chlamydomonas reinhardtii]|eukprot:XP_001690070.1 transaldolase [Chlamydomonas reinhardtii]
MSLLRAPTSCSRTVQSQQGRSRKSPVVRAYLEEKKAPLPPPRGPYSTVPAQTFKNQLEALKSMSVVVADTGELDLVKKYHPQDCTTNPSLVYKALSMPENRHYLEKALAKDKRQPEHVHAGVSRPYAGVADQLAVDLGAELLKIVPGRVSTEVDANLSYSTQASVDKALRIMELYAAKGYNPSRIYIKLASTWEGIEACRRLEKQGINCNMTLLFSFAQAAACADAGATLISPFVGRIMDWYKAKEGRDFASHEDPGVLSVKRIYNYYKAHHYKTIVMAASFRNAGEIRELAGCDNITISPQLLDELQKSTEPLDRKLTPEKAQTDALKLSNMHEDLFVKLHGADQMAVEKLDQGIKGFVADQKKLEDLLASIAMMQVRENH